MRLKAQILIGAEDWEDIGLLSQISKHDILEFISKVIKNNNPSIKTWSLADGTTHMLEFTILPEDRIICL